MNVAVFLKDHLKNIPPYLGQILNRWPYSSRPGIGEVYRNRRVEIKSIEAMTSAQKERFILNRLIRLVNYAYSNVPFYRDYYDSKGFNPSMLKVFSDIQKIPIVTKSILNKYDLESRSAERKGRYIVNTGGSSGTPFGFFIEPSSIGHEWAHMHTIWEKLDYRASDFKFGFGGRSNVRDLIDYDVVRNTFAVDLYASFEDICNKMTSVLKKYNVSYLHGYPSSIYEFALYCEKYNLELLKLLRKSLRGAFLGSEYPYLHYRDAIERIFDIQTISWYGHTERAVLAYENSTKFCYEPFLSYGYSEAIVNGDGELDLIGTSYYNFASPFIRYNTEDIIQNVTYDGSILKSFQILKGRSGEFVTDRLGKKINLTALIFGRHHELFNHAKFIQIKQVDKGKVEIYFVSNSINEEVAEKLFDKKNLDIDLSFIKIEEPIRSVSGKVSLLIK